MGFEMVPGAIAVTTLWHTYDAEGYPAYPYDSRGKSLRIQTSESPLTLLVIQPRMTNKGKQHQTEESTGPPPEWSLLWIVFRSILGHIRRCRLPPSPSPFMRAAKRPITPRTKSPHKSALSLAGGPGLNSVPPATPHSTQTSMTPTISINEPTAPKCESDCF
jgi:hypothetical protein